MSYIKVSYHDLKDMSGFCILWSRGEGSYNDVN